MSGLVGHQDVLAKLENYASLGTLSGSWIFSGLKGVGKAYTAKILAERLIKGNEANLKIIERDITDVEKKALIKLIADGKTIDKNTEALRDRKKDITVDDVRALEAFTSYKSLDDTPKIIIIDSVDEMNNNAANALLKTLEEPPPQTVMILISHQMQKLLPTIKSRCKVMKFMPIPDAEMSVHLHENFTTLKDIDLIIKLSEGSIGKAYELIANEGGILYNDIIDGFVMGKKPSLVNKENIDLAFELVFVGMTRLLKFIEGVNDTLPLEIIAFDTLHPPADKLIRLLQDSMQKYNASNNIHLDKMAILDNIFYKLKRLK